MQINRLFEIVYILLDKDKVSAKELSEHFEVSTRTIYRDVDILSSAGIPVFMSKGKGGGIGLLPDFVLNKAVLTETEKSNIFSALQSLNIVDGQSVSNSLSKLGLLFGENNTGFIEIDYSDWGNVIKDQFEKSKKAILTRKILSFKYISGKNQITNRRVEPYILWYKGKNWYLKSFCMDKYDFRVFKLSRMRNVTIKEDSYVPRKMIIQNTSENHGDYPSEIIQLRIEKGQACRVVDEFPEEDVVENPDGSFNVTMNFIEDDWVYGYIMSFGSFATVLSPDHVRNTIKKRLKDSLDKYI